MTTTYNERVIEEMRSDIRNILHEWDLPTDSKVSLLNISENATFIAKPPMDNDGDSVILRVHRPDYHTKQEIESELVWVDSLRIQGIVSTAEPLEVRSGGKISSLKNGSGERFVVGFEFLSGNEPSPENDLRQDFFTLGAITAKLHDHTKSWATPIGFKRKIWDFDSMLGNTPLWGDWRRAIGLDQNCAGILNETVNLLEQQLDTYGKDKSKFGLIHADLRLANLLIDGEKLNVIDFDDCGYSWLMYDFAAAISFMEEDEQIPDLQKSWVEGYRSISFLTEEDEAALPMFVILRRILLTAWLASHSETETAQELGAGYTNGTIRLAKQYLAQFK
jgi:Ser/Thr protein kinase RdoA (MazF antagonist)